MQVKNDVMRLRPVNWLLIIIVIAVSIGIVTFSGMNCDCEDNSDCPLGQICVMGSCTKPPAVECNGGEPCDSAPGGCCSPGQQCTEACGCCGSGSQCIGSVCCTGENVCGSECCGGDTKCSHGGGCVHCIRCSQSSDTCCSSDEKCTMDNSGSFSCQTCATPCINPACCKATERCVFGKCESIDGEPTPTPDCVPACVAPYRCIDGVCRSEEQCNEPTPENQACIPPCYSWESCVSGQCVPYYPITQTTWQETWAKIKDTAPQPTPQPDTDPVTSKYDWLQPLLNKNAYTGEPIFDIPYTFPYTKEGMIAYVRLVQAQTHYSTARIIRELRENCFGDGSGSPNNLAYEYDGFFQTFGNKRSIKMDGLPTVIEVDGERFDMGHNWVGMEAYLNPDGSLKSNYNDAKADSRFWTDTGDIIEAEIMSVVWADKEKAYELKYGWDDRRGNILSHIGGDRLWLTGGQDELGDVLEYAFDAYFSSPPPWNGLVIGTPVCGEACFNDALQTCSPLVYSTFLNDMLTVTYSERLSIIGQESGKCHIRIQFDMVNRGASPLDIDPKLEKVLLTFEARLNHQKIDCYPTLAEAQAGDIMLNCNSTMSQKSNPTAYDSDIDYLLEAVAEFNVRNMMDRLSELNSSIDLTKALNCNEITRGVNCGSWSQCPGGAQWQTCCMSKRYGMDFMYQYSDVCTGWTGSGGCCNLGFVLQKEVLDAGGEPLYDGELCTSVTTPEIYRWVYVEQVVPIESSQVPSYMLPLLDQCVPPCRLGMHCGSHGICVPD